MKINRNNGITLIALIITVIVLLILAGTAISIAINGGDIFSKASTAREEWNGAVAKEQTQIDDLLGILNSKMLVQMYHDGELNIGDYVEYVPSSTSRTVTLTSEKTGVEGTQVYSYNSDVTWRVLGIEGTGSNEHILLISGSPLMKDMTLSTGGKTDGTMDPYLHLCGAEGFAWTNDEYVTAGYIDENILDSICKIYANSTLAAEARSIRLEDINNALGVELCGTGLYKKTDTAHTNDLLVRRTIGTVYEYHNGDYAPENYLAETYPDRFGSLTTKVAGDTVTGMFFEYRISNVINKTSTLYELLFKDTEGVASEYNLPGAKAYWLPYYGAYAYTDIGASCFFGPGGVASAYVSSLRGGLFGSTGYVNQYAFAVRPVVCLKTGTTNNQVKLISGGSESVWNTTTGHNINSPASAGRITSE